MSLKFSDLSYRWRLGLGFLLLLALLTGLFIQAGEVSPAAHYTYLQSLRRIQQADVELDAAVLASYANLLQNDDPLMRHLGEIRAEQQQLQRIPRSLAAADRMLVAQAVIRLGAAEQEKAAAIDRFRRDNAVLRNSELYFPQGAETLLQTPGWPGAAVFGRFARHLLSFTRGANIVDGDQLRAELAQVRQLAPPAGKLALPHLLVHAQVIIDQRPEINALVGSILHSPTADLREAVSRVYLAGHERALRVAGTYRRLLYLVSLLLTIYVVYALYRIERDRRDLAARYEAQRRAERELRLYGTVFSHASEGMVITDGESRIVAVNPAFSAISGYAAAEVIGRNPSVLNSGRQGKEFYHQMWQALTADGHWQGEIWNRRKDGAIYPEWLSVATVRNEQGEVTHYTGIFTDISERKQQEARIHHLAHHDALTGLPNRILLEDRISQGLLKSKRGDRALALIFIDLDRFKNVNDTLGHEIGDQLLAQAAQRGLSVLRDTDTLSRLGGDEFVAVLPELEQRQAAAHLARKLLTTFCQPYLLAGHELTVTASAGIALFPEDGESVGELLRKADAAMYRAKDEGRNTFRFFSSEINTASLGELLLESELHGALERGELRIHYQPKVSAQTGELVGAEALMRWQHREFGMLGPDRFIPLAEENGLINAFGEWAINTVCAQQRAWLDAGLLVVPVAVNISAQQFAQQDLPRLVANALAEHGIPPQVLDLELTESLLMRNSSRAAEVLGTLRKMHVHVAIDDFGTGYSSLSYLKLFPAQSLKIDRSFVCEIGEHGEDVRLVSAIIAMAHELDLAVIAEGVENESQRDYLLAHGCDQFQGYLFGRPQAAEEFGSLLAGLRLEGISA